MVKLIHVKEVGVMPQGPTLQAGRGLERPGTTNGVLCVYVIDVASCDGCFFFFNF